MSHECQIISFLKKTQFRRIFRHIWCCHCSRKLEIQAKQIIIIGMFLFKNINIGRVNHKYVILK